MKKGLICLSFILLFATSVLSQNSIGKSLENVIPSSPNAASLGKYGDVPIGLSTGVPSIAIPIYEIKVGGMRVPIAATYNASGVKAEEIASSIGLGWALNSGGVITRQQRGGPDEGGTVNNMGVTGYMNNEKKISYYDSLQNVSPNSSELSSMEVEAANGRYDAEPDIFYFNFCGYSGRFAYSQNAGKFICIPEAPYKVSYSSTNQSFLIITDDGTKYFFNDFELNSTSSYCNELNRPGNAANTSWYLSQIINQNNTDTITFYYDSRLISYYSLGNSIRKNYLRTVYHDPASDGQPPSQTYNSDCLILNSINRRVLKKIKARGIEIDFIEDSSPREDVPDDYATKFIIIKNSNGLIINKYEFVYDYFHDSNQYGGTNLGSQYLKRLKLLSIKDRGNNNPYPRQHQFSYNASAMGGRLSYAEDFWGYFNGKENTTLAPSQVIINNGVILKLPGADRTIDTLNAQSYILNKIVYPTGGATEFSYESNTVPRQTNNYLPPPMIDTAISLHDLKEHNVELQDEYTTTFTINVPPLEYNGGQGGTFAHIEINPVCGDELRSDCAGFSIDGPNVSYSFSSNVVDRYLPNGTYTMTANLRPLKNPANNNPDNGYFLFAISYKVVDVRSQGKNSLSGGLRIKEIKTYDSASKTIARKIYKYNLEEDSLMSSGSTLAIPFFADVERDELNIYHPESGTTNVMVGDYWVRTSGSLYPLLTSAGSYTSYSRVEEINTSPELNGKTVYEFTTGNVDLNNSTLFPYPPPYDPDWSRAVQTRKTVQSFISNQIKTIQQQSTAYNSWVKNSGFDYHSTDYPIKGFKTGYNYYKSTVTVGAGEEVFPVFSPTTEYAPLVQLYTMAMGGILKRSDTTKIYSSVNATILQQRNDYEYNYQNYQLSKITTYTSDGKKKEQFFKYPIDNYTAYWGDQTAIDTMKNRNFISSPIVDSLVVDNVNIQLTLNQYGLVGNQLIPIAVKQKFQGGNLDNVLNVLKFDSYDNPLEYQKRNSSINSYIWGYNNTYPIAEAINTTWNNIFYTSFEDAEGNSADDDSKTGKKSRVNGYQKFLSNLSNGQYVLSYWQKSDNSWTFQTNTVSVSSGSFIITLAGQIDELRLYPQGAQMTTYTYEPLIGISSQTDVNNRTTYYEYDGMGRLSLIRDEDGNIVKKYCYNYAGQVEDCGVISTAPLWQTTGLTQCKPCPQNSAYFSTIQQHQEKDNNVNSPGYGNTRWVDDGVSSSCVPQADWQNTGAVQCEVDLYDLNGNPLTYTGNQLKEQKDMNSCSATYNTSRWVSNGQNCTSCPKPANWQSTGNYRCMLSGGVNTGTQEREEKDMESCSSTYNQFRWVSNGTNCTSCPKPASWQSTGNYRCVKDASNANTGTQEREETDIESCSSTYNQLRWVSNGTNCASCPKPQQWQATGNYRCVKDANGNNTGAQEREERNVESCSVDYNTLRWVSNGTSCSSCPKPANWQATGNYRCVKDANNNNTGYQEREEKDMESCSSTYTQLRWVNNGYNATSCPVPCSPANCGGDDRKCVNGVCETGSLVVVSSVYQKVLVDGLYQWRWVCTRQYCFSDGTYSTYSEQSYQTTSCPVDFCDVPLE